MSVTFPPVPPQLKPLNHFLKVAAEHETRDPVVAYWARFHAVQTGLLIDKSSTEAKQLLFGLLDWLEKRKKQLNNEAINNDAVGEAHIENYAFKIFSWAEEQEKQSVHNKNVVKAFYTAGVLFDILTNFNKDLSEDIEKRRKYAKWRAAYIHNCLKNGEIPEVPQDSYQEYDEGAQDMNIPGEPSPRGSSANIAPGSSNSGGGVFPGVISSSGGLGFNLPNLPPPPQPPNPQQFFYPDGNGGAQGGAGAYQPPPQQSVQSPVAPSVDFPGPAVGHTDLSIEQIAKAQKYCKWAGSALNFDDVSTAVMNLRKALALLTTGQEMVE